MDAGAGDIERRALELFEELSDHPKDSGYRETLLAQEPEAVLTRLAALEISAALADALPTELPESSRRWRAPPDRVGAFRVTELIGEGGMGQVWKAVRNDGLYDQTVAVKIVHAHVGALASSRFAAERRILARLEHPSIARLIDGGVLPDGTPFLVMEYVDGRALDAVAAGLSLDRRIALFLQAAEAVQFAHERLVVHADLKPSNILVDAAGRLKLLDFGIARLVEEDVGGEGEAQPMTRAYASPARLAGAAPIVADDVYALGLILGELVGEVRDADLQAITRMAQAEDEGVRYGSVAALTADLGRWREQLPVTARAGGYGYRMGRFLRRHRVGVSASAAAMIVLATTTVTATVSYLRAEKASAEARARFDDVRGTARYLLFDLGDRLERQPQSLALRADVARVSQSYLDRLAKSENASPEVRLESVEGLLRLAERQAKPGRPNLRLIPQANRNLENAYGLARNIPGAEGRRLQAQIRLDQTRLATMNEIDIKGGERFLGEARALIFDPKAPIPALQGGYFRELSTLRQWQGRYPEAIDAARRGLAAPAAAEPRDAMLQRASLYDLLAEGLYYSGAPPQAEAPYREQLALLEEADRRWPGDPGALRQLARSRWALGTTLLELNRAAEALPILEKSSTEARAAAEFDTADREAARGADISQNAYAQALSLTGRGAEAAAMLSVSVEKRRKALAAAPGDAMLLRDYAISMSQLADVELGIGRTADGCGRYREVMTLFERQRSAGRKTVLDDDSTLKSAGAQIARYCR